MILTELFNSKVPYEVKRSDGRVFRTEAIINGRKIVFRAELVSDPGAGGFWDISFEEQDPNVRGIGTYGKTGSGKAFEVGAAVKASLKEFCDRYHPEVLYFTADADSSTRANLYRRIANQVLVGYELEETKGYVETTFVYRRGV